MNGKATEATATEEGAPPDAGERRGAILPRLNRDFSVDLGMLALGAGIAGAADESVSQGGLGWGLAFVAVTFVVLKLRGSYAFSVHVTVVDGLARIVGATSTAAIVVLSARLVADDTLGAASQAVRLWIATTVCLAVGRASRAMWLRVRRRSGHGLTPTLIVGARPVGRRIARRLLGSPELGLLPIGFLDDEPDRVDRFAPSLRVLGTTDDLDRIVRSRHVGHVIVAFASASPEALLGVIRHCAEIGARVSIVPRLFEEVSGRVYIDHLGGIPLLRSRRVTPDSWQFTAKYATDRVVAAVALILLSPLLLALALLVKLTSSGPVFFRQHRVGLDGREFSMLKFRTMRGEPSRYGEWDAFWAAQVIGGCPDGEPSGAANGDAHAKSNGSFDGATAGARPLDRRTAAGKLLRATSLDELPQLINVLRGDMSLVGPRPERTAYVRAFQEHVHRYSDRHRVKSGLTGWAQVHGLRGESAMADRVEWDNYYIENWSLALDCRILFLTVPAMLRREPR